jgi:hypothetical protein
MAKPHRFKDVLFLCLRTARILATLLLLCLLFIWARLLLWVVPLRNVTLSLRWSLLVFLAVCGVAILVFPWSKYGPHWLRRSLRKAGRQPRSWALPAHALVVTVALFLIAENTISPHLRYVADGRLWRASREEYRLNQMGLRGPDLPYEKADDTYRILCLGCSVTFGFGVDEAQFTYPLQLQSILRERYASPRIEVINAGVLGYSSFQGLSYLETELLKYRPDLVITYFGLHELLVPEAEVADQNGQPYLSPLWKTLVERSRVAEGLQLIHWLYLRGTWRDFGDEAAETLRHNYRFNLDRMEEIGQRSHFRVYDIIPIEIIDGPPRRVFSPPAWRADRLLDIYPEFAAKGDKVRDFFLDRYCHLSPRGHRLVAEILSRLIEERGLISKEVERVPEAGTGG